MKCFGINRLVHLDWLKIMYNYNTCTVYITSGLITYLANLLCAMASSGKLPITYPLFWKKKKKKKKPDAIESLLKSCGTVLSNRKTSLWLTKFEVCSVLVTDQVFLLGFLAQVQSVEEKEKGCVTYSMDQENEVSKIFSVSLGSNKVNSKI